ncbi:hypothetical protein ACFOD4_05725 [Pseudoroseomonas globiformis]|uniref:Uncharacterized protein n=1 Tax=Teichococcus globiformis TaxID=2307229 RepID=A0ABV7G1K2_9PROT
MVLLLARWSLLAQVVHDLYNDENLLGEVRDMSLLLVVHDQPAEGAQALEDAVWQLAESHLTLPGALIVESGVSPRYLQEHLSGAMRRAGIAGPLLVTPVAEASWQGLSPEAEEWMRARLA